MAGTRSVTVATSADPVTDVMLARLRPVLAVVQPMGWVWLGAAAICLLAGAVLSWPELIVLGVFLAVIFVLAALFVIGRSTYSVWLELPHTRVQVGDQVGASLVIGNSGRRPVLPCLFVTPVGQGSITTAVPHLVSGQVHYESVGIPTGRRQVLTLGPVRSSRGDALGLFKRETNWTGQQELLIHPKTVRLQHDTTGFLKDLEGLATDTLSSSDVAFHALREYEVGDDLRHVHWLTSARVGKLMVRQFEETRRSHLVVCLSMSPEDYATDEDFELACSAAASLAKAAIQNYVGVTLQTAGGSLHAATVQQMLDDCTRLKFGGECNPVTLVAQAAASLALDASVAVIVTGTKIPASRLHAAMSSFPVDVITSAIRCQAGVILSRNSVGGNPALTLGRLDDLPKAMRGLVV